MRYARIYPWRRTRRSRAPSNGPDAFFVAQFSAGYTTNMFGFDLRQGQELTASQLSNPAQQTPTTGLYPPVGLKTAALMRGRAMRTPRSFRSRNATYIIAVISASLKASC